MYSSDRYMNAYLIEKIDINGETPYPITRAILHRETALEAYNKQAAYFIGVFCKEHKIKYVDLKNALHREVATEKIEVDGTTLELNIIGKHNKVLIIKKGDQLTQYLRLKFLPINE